MNMIDGIFSNGNIHLLECLAEEEGGRDSFKQLSCEVYVPTKNEIKPHVRYYTYHRLDNDIIKNKFKDFRQAVEFYNTINLE